jgi:hypothetical protein
LPFRLRGSGGIRADSRVHAVEDGAPWIVRQIEDLFGEQGSYLIDFYHVCEYLSAAAKTIAPDAAAGKDWMEAQKDALKTGRVDEVLRGLVSHREAPDVSDDQAPVRVCHRYVGARKDQLKYRDALAENGLMAASAFLRRSAFGTEVRPTFRTSG